MPLGVNVVKARVLCKDVQRQWCGKMLHVESVDDLLMWLSEYLYRR